MSTKKGTRLSLSTSNLLKLQATDVFMSTAYAIVIYWASAVLMTNNFCRRENLFDILFYGNWSQLGNKLFSFHDLSAGE